MYMYIYVYMYIYIYICIYIYIYGSGLFTVMPTFPLPLSYCNYFLFDALFFDLLFVGLGAFMIGGFGGMFVA